MTIFKYRYGKVTGIPAFQIPAKSVGKLPMDQAKVALLRAVARADAPERALATRVEFLQGMASKLTDTVPMLS